MDTAMMNDLLLGAAATSKLWTPRGSKAKKVSKQRKISSYVVRMSDFSGTATPYRLVWRGAFTKTSGGLSKSDLAISKRGRVVSSRRSKRGVEAFVNNNCDLWMASLMEVRSECAIIGFVSPRRTGGLELQRELYKKTLEGFVTKNVERLNQNLQVPSIKDLLLRKSTAPAPAPSTPQEVPAQLSPVKVEPPMSPARPAAMTAVPTVAPTPAQTEAPPPILPNSAPVEAPAVASTVAPTPAPTEKPKSRNQRKRNLERQNSTTAPSTLPAPMADCKEEDLGTAKLDSSDCAAMEVEPENFVKVEG